ncbi:hypothetical protein L6R52_06765, partial [Myxococcota bacterium]|nr:hypothetical protein [Myxococcota bacterium]
MTIVLRLGDHTGKSGASRGGASASTAARSTSMTERRTADAPAEHGEDTPWRGPASELGEVPGRSRSALLHHALIGALAVSIAVQLFHIALQSSVLQVATVGALAPHTSYDPEDTVASAFVFGFGAELAIGLVTGALWLA